MIKEKTKKNKKGFVLLFAVTIAAIMLAIALGVADIALKEIKFSTSARDTNEAFFAADTGIEYAFLRDKGSASFFSLLSTENSNTWQFTLDRLGSGGQSCVQVEVKKERITPASSVPPKLPYIATTVISKGYSVGTSPTDPTKPASGVIGNVSASCENIINSVEREIESTY